MSTEVTDAPVKRGRPRTLKPMGEIEGAVEKKAEESNSLGILPYTDSKSLPAASVTVKGKKRIIKAGAPRYATHTTGNVVEVIAVYRNAKGIGRRLVRSLKPSMKPHDKALLAKLRKAGVGEI